MSELRTEFQSLPEEFQKVILLAQEQYKIMVAPLQLLVGGWSGAIVYLVSVIANDTGGVEHCILKLDHKGKSAKSDEVTRHNIVMSKSTAVFVREHVAELVFDQVEHEGAIAIFYRIAGQSLLQYRPLSNYGRENQLKAIFTATNAVLLTEWNVNQTFERAVHPQKVLQNWLGFRLDTGGNIEQFLQSTCRVDPDTAGFLIGGDVYPNPLVYARKAEHWGKARPIDITTGFIHGDLNTNNILLKFAENNADLEGYYLIDFALFKENMPLLYDQRYLEMSYLMQAMSQLSFAKCVNFLTLMAVADVPDAQKVPIEMSGVGAVFASARSAFAEWLGANHPSLHDDLWGQYWLAGVAAGLSYTHKAGQPDEGRLAGLIYAAANLKRYASTFSLPLPTNVELLYDENQSDFNKPVSVPSQDIPARALPSGTVTFLFTDIEGSTKLAQQYPEAMPALLRRHQEILEKAIKAHNGFTFHSAGDSFAVAFHNASDALNAALDSQRALHQEAWLPVPIQVRMGIHSGTAQLQDASKSERYSGYTTLATSQRIMSAGHGGQILLSQTAADLTHDRLPAGAHLTDMGIQRLKDIIQPEHLYQLAAPDLPSDFAPLATSEVVRHNLPMQLTEFIGRKKELAAIKALLSDVRNRLITIVAPGGAGKTRLAIQAAAEVSTDYADGVSFVGFADIGSNDDMMQTVAESLGIALTADEETKTQLLTYLAPRQQLLVLDNLEHLDGAAAIIAEILKAAPNVKVVATSRSKLNLSGETVLSPAGLDITWDHPEDAMQASGTQLFIQAAKRSNPSFVLKTDDLGALAEILHLVDGMPLGILLAAAWVDMLSMGEIAAEIRKSFDFLETEMRDIPMRQRSVRAVFDTSWGLLSPQEKDTFAALSVFRGGFSREAAEAIAGASLRGLASLVNKSLLTANPDTKRYEIHELLRQYAAAELEKDHDRFRQIRDSHAAYYADVMGEAPSLISHGKQAELIDMMERDIENIRSAWRLLIATSDARKAHKFVLGLWFLYEIRGWYSASIALFNDALELLPEDADDEEITVLRALASAVKGWSLALLSQPKAAVIAATGPAELLALSSNLIDYWIAVQCLAMALDYLGSVKEMAAQLDKAIKRVESLDERLWLAALKDWRAFAAVEGEDFDGATRFAKEATELLGSADEYWVTIWNLELYAMIAIHENRPDDAIDLYGELVASCRRISYVRGMMVSLEGLGEANVAAGRLDAAEQAFVEGIAAAEQMGMVRDMLNMMTKVARVWRQRGEPVEAVELLATVLAEPTSVHKPFSGSTPINKVASVALSELEAELDPKAYANAFARGSKRPYDVAADQLIGKFQYAGRY